MVHLHYFSNQIESHYQVSPRHITYALHWPFKDELECLQQNDIISALGIDETTEWCNSSILVPKLNGKDMLCLDPARLNQALIGLVNRGPMNNDILPN